MRSEIMFKRIAVGIAAATIPILGTVSAMPAGAASVSKQHMSHESPHHCHASYFGEDGNEGISLNCTDAPDDFQVIAECASLLSEWWQYGSIGENAPGHSVAVCHGWLIFGARVVDYHVVDISD
jgi:hypothetical protein